MNKTPYTFVSFGLGLFPGQLRAFRGAVIESAMSFKPVFEAAGIPTDIFHNHAETVPLSSTSEIPLETEEPDTKFRYPLIQYKIRHKKAAILGLGAGAQALQLWMSLAGDGLNYQGTDVPLSLKDHRHGYWTPDVADKISYYRLNKWLP